MGTVSPPEAQANTQPGTYTGDIILDVDGKSRELPVTLTVTLEIEKLLDVEVEALTKSLLKEEYCCLSTRMPFL